MSHFARTARLVGTLCCGALCLVPAHKALASARDLEVRVNLKNSPKAIVDEAWQVVHRNYVDQSFNQVNWLKARETLLDQDYTTRQQAYAAIRKALQPLDDPYTRFMDPKQFKSLTRQTSGELMGIGIMLLNDAATGQPVILKVVSDSPAEKAGLKAGDAILKVGDRSTDKLAAAEVAKLLRGEAKSVVKIQLKRKKQLMSVAIVRDLIQLQAVSYKIKKESSNRIGYIQVSEFSRHTSKQMQKAINELTLAEVDAFVLDLRGNPGGLLDSSIEIAQMWINRGLIVRTVDRSGQPAKFYARRKALTDLPLAVLVNQSSASSSEILTGALKDNKRATVIGTKTFGKALVQAVHQLADGSGLAVTVAQYYTPNGTDISRTGITPDIQISMPTAQALRLKNNQRLRTSNVDQPYQQAVRVLNRQLRKSKQSYNFFRKPSGPIDFSVPDQQWGVQS